MSTDIKNALVTLNKRHVSYISYHEINAAKYFSLFEITGEKGRITQSRTDH